MFWYLLAYMHIYSLHAFLLICTCLQYIYICVCMKINASFPSFLSKSWRSILMTERSNPRLAFLIVVCGIEMDKSMRDVFFREFLVIGNHYFHLLSARVFVKYIDTMFVLVCGLLFFLTNGPLFEVAKWANDFENRGSHTQTQDSPKGIGWGHTLSICLFCLFCFLFFSSWGPYTWWIDFVVDTRTPKMRAPPTTPGSRYA